MQDLLDCDYTSLFFVSFQVVPNISFFISDFKGVTILSPWSSPVTNNLWFLVLCKWNSLSWVSSSNRIWIICFLFSTEDRTTFWTGNFVFQSRWCFLVTPISLPSRVVDNAILMISVEDEVDVTADQVWSYPFLDIHDEILLPNHQYSPKKSRSIYDSDICITSITKWWFMNRLWIKSSTIIQRAWTIWGNFLALSILGIPPNTSERTSESLLSVINDNLAPTKLIRGCILPRRWYISLKVSGWSMVCRIVGHASRHWMSGLFEL